MPDDQGGLGALMPTIMPVDLNLKRVTEAAALFVDSAGHNRSIGIITVYLCVVPINPGIPDPLLPIF